MNRIKQIITRTGVALIVTVLLTLVISAPAFAGDNKVYPGSACLPQSPTDASNFFRAGGVARVGSDRFNTSIHCPVVRDITSTAGGGGPDAFIDVKGSGFNRNTCELRTYTVTGELHQNRGDDDGTLESIGNGALRYRIDNIPQIDQGAYEVACRMPQNTQLVRYSISE